jgi:DNA-binding GntR family transcriptional regulator
MNPVPFEPAAVQPRSRPTTRSTSRGPFAEQAYMHLRGAIVRGEMPHEKAVSSAEICASLKISRTPVREALIRLELEGYLTRDQANRLTVNVPTRAQVTESFWLREILEVHAVGLAARRISDTELTAVDELLKADRDALAVGQVDSLAWTNDAIHDLILGASRNRSLVNLVKGLRAKVQGIHTFAVGSSDDQASFVHQHEQIGDALREGDAQTAMELTRIHLRQARDVLLDELDDAGSRDADDVQALPDPRLLRIPFLDEDVQLAYPAHSADTPPPQVLNVVPAIPRRRPE